MIYDNSPVLANQAEYIELNGNETMTMLFNCFESGFYEIISNSHDSVKIEFRDKNGDRIENNY